METNGDPYESITSTPPTPPQTISEHHNEHHKKVDNSSKLLEKIANLYAERLLSDIILDVGGKEYAAHRLILCASSDVFQVMLMNQNWTESKESTIKLTEEDQCAKVFPDFLKYLYTGIIHFNHHVVLPLALLADKYNVRDLVVLCVEYMRQHIVSSIKSNQFISWIQWILNCSHEPTITAFINFFAWNFQEVAQTKDFVTLETEILIIFLKKSDLVVTDEFVLFQIVLKWLEYQESKLKLLGHEFFNSILSLIMKHIRFIMMSPTKLAQLLIFPLVLKYRDFFIDLMSQAMMYHSNQLTHGKTEIPTAWLTPRLYTTEIWGSSLVIEGFSHLPMFGVRTLVFNTPYSLAEWEQNIYEKYSDNSRSENGTLEWAIDVYPKGVWFSKSLCILWQGSFEVPEWRCKTVRLSISPVKRTPHHKVSIGILISGKVDDIEYVNTVIKKEFLFTRSENLLNIDDLIPYDDLNSFEDQMKASRKKKKRSTTQTNDKSIEASPYLVGADNDTLKVHIVITPLAHIP